ncbi:MAG: aminopeptidase P family protein [Acetobacteraceae bacterium]|nr:aminopeptidase P family protein [Acetobacteraceae bacterium]
MQDKIAQELFFTPAEYDARLAKIRAGMARRGIDTLLCAGPENIFYGSGYQTFGFHNYQLLVIPLAAAPFLILRYLESIQARRYSWVQDVVTWDDTDDPVGVTIRELKARGLAEGCVGTEDNAYFFQVASWKKLNAGLARLVNGSGTVEAARAVKSPQELAFMREAARMTDLGMEAATAEIREGRTDNDVAAAAFDAMTRAGAEWLTRDPIVTSGDRSGLPHTCYMGKKLAAGDAVLLEFSGVHRRYYAPMMRGAVVGRADSRVRRMADVCIEALNAAIDRVRPGATSAEVDRAARSVIERAGMWENYRKRSGYSVGIGFSSWVEGGVASLKEDDPTVLAPGMCFHIPIALRIYGEAGVGFSETVSVTGTGAEILGRAPRALAEC